MNIDLYSYSGIGGRPVNEDSYVTGNGYFIVSDGLGGHDNGELASGAVTRYIAENFTSPDLSNEHISSLIQGADEAVKQFGDGGKATLAALFTDGNMIRLANIGDSRVYYFRGGSILFRTKDHSVCQASVDMGEMTDIDVRNSADRSGLFKVLGDSAPLKLPKPYDLIDPINGDAFLICSDGFWEHIYEAEMEADLLKSYSAKEWLEHMLKRHLVRSKNNGDNFTAICGIIKSEKVVPYTIAAPADDIPRTVELTADTVQPSVSFKSKIIIAACALIAVAAIAAAVILLIVNKGTSDAPPISSSSESQTIEDSSSTVEIPSTEEATSTVEAPSTEESPSTVEVPSTVEAPSTEGTLPTAESPSTEEAPSTEGIPNEPEAPNEPFDPELPNILPSLEPSIL
ncbi:MAG: protein phosphatase 2C domain-containing protein [Oscillospiraceae bacterium]|nr:protein phosphatase 2C domain-containing protein [Oscillospiraceae bacterium]